MQEKLSEILLEMIEPYHDGSKKEMELLITIAIFGWNMSLLPDDKTILEDFLAVFDNDEDIEELVNDFKLCKELNYKDDNRLIVDYKLRRKGNDLDLQIKSTQINEKVDITKKNKKARRNETCPCGSGMKYKYCCGK